jgi:hypothetical protein
MKNPGDKAGFSERRLDKATKHVASLWFPINPQQLQFIRDSFGKNTYTKNPDKLLEDLKKDFALFTFLVKELMPIATKERVAAAIVHNPAELIRWAGVQRIGDIIKNDSLLPFSHVFNALEPFQADRLRETAIVASTAEVLSESHNLDPDTGFCHGVIREIGLNLVAWNYPTMYSRVIKSLTPGKTLDEELSRELGFSPSLLAIRVLRPEALPPTSDSEADSIQKTWESYDQLCEIGEALARAENPETYPSAENDWTLANDYLKKTVGEKGVDLIKNRAVEHSKEYHKTLNHLFASLAEFNPGKKLSTFKKRLSARKNKYLPQCAPEIQAALRNLYEQMADPKSVRGVLESLLRTVIPQAGFTGGCVFIVDPAAMALRPRTVFGDVRMRPIERVGLRRSQAEQAVDTLSITHSDAKLCETDLAATALSCAQPVLERHHDVLEPPITGMYGSLGEIRRIGVLYLETPEPPDMEKEQQYLGTFKAMRQALADALHLE